MPQLFGPVPLHNYRVALLQSKQASFILARGFRESLAALHGIFRSPGGAVCKIPEILPLKLALGCKLRCFALQVLVLRSGSSELCDLDVLENRGWLRLLQDVHVRSCEVEKIWRNSHVCSMLALGHCLELAKRALLDYNIKVQACSHIFNALHYVILQV